MGKFIYIQKPIEKLRKDYSRRTANGINEFKDFDSFYIWYNSQSKQCHYCELKEEECQQIVTQSILTSARFPVNGKLERGRSRGMWLEVDRVEPNGKYNELNCVLCCYFCNNDKSDVFSASQYLQFRNNRTEYLKGLLKSK